MKRMLILLAAIAIFAIISPVIVLGECCTANDNGSGTIDYPPDCPFDGALPMMIIDGLPPGSTMELSGPIQNFYNVQNFPGGTLGGEICTFNAEIEWDLVGTGDLIGYHRNITLPLEGEIHIGPRNPGDPVQSFDQDMFRLSGQLFGDPDFDQLFLIAGTDYGLPGPGHATLTQLPSGDFAIDSFFDITYRIDFAGAPGSPLDGLSGSTTHSVRRQTEQTFNIDWCRLQWPRTIEELPGAIVTTYGHLYIGGLTDQTTGTDPHPNVLAQAGYGPNGSDPAGGGWTWIDAVPNPFWNDSGEPNNDEYMADLITPGPGAYDFCYRFSGNCGGFWTYGDLDNGSGDGYQPENAGQMTVISNLCCQAPDNGAGTVDFPPDCPFDGPDPMLIINGLPAGATLEFDGPFENFINVVNTPGGALGGEICTFNAEFSWAVSGTGALAGYTRLIYMPLEGEIHIGPRTLGDPLQAFPARIESLTGDLFGDPDFCTLGVRAGNSFGLPSPGYVTLTELPSGDFAVDSFFDITYEIDFEGCPGSPLDDYAGLTTGTVRRFTCNTYDVAWGKLQWPLTIDGSPGEIETVYGHVFIDGVTTRSTGTDPIPGIVRAQVGYGADGSDPSAGGWTWFEGEANPGWNDGGEPNNDEYQAELILPPLPGDYDFCYRYSGDGGLTWLYADDGGGGSADGYQPENAGQMTVQEEICCIAPDNGAGTIDFPPDCPYLGPDPMMIISGLPAGTTIELAGPMENFFNVVNIPGGTLGGEICTFNAQLTWDLTGTGSLAGFTRHIIMPVEGEIHIGPRTSGDPVQLFPADLFRLTGQVFGDPDFDLLQLTAGTDYGLPSPGHTTLSRLDDGNFAVDSFFDITYQIDFAGAPGSMLDGLSGSTIGTVFRETCPAATEVPDTPADSEIITKLFLAPNRPNPFGQSTRIEYAIPADASGGLVSLRVYDAGGRLIRTLVDTPQPAGFHNTSWDGRDRSGKPVGGGIYFYQLTVGNKKLSGRMVMLK
ncbi:MAG: hypothetical protein KJ970_17740 [Candidatus Eisenbacteria bacterium]|uniref:FlgD/Vpr Ig-like domain-containing protein n=1 Tax=Eiseniibacteriota bacterium TaxID=2212470 RepID=A0A948RXC1_UNCEI|nr:hypothetical protein [Candidatus Eisenbacteria bacterium]